MSGASTGDSGGKVFDHDYDGIQEYDNPQPGWWNLLFFATIVFSVGYALYFHLGGPGLSETQAYTAEADEARQRAERLAPPIKADEGLLTQLGTDNAALTAGREVFAKNCIACHKPDGSGLIGPNLTDEHQIHGSRRMDIYNTVYNGVLAKGMVAWGKVLRPRELVNVVAYVSSLRGKNLPGKPAEGAKVGPLK